MCTAGPLFNVPYTFVFIFFLDGIGLFGNLLIFIKFIFVEVSYVHMILAENVDAYNIRDTLYAAIRDTTSEMI